MAAIRKACAKNVDLDAPKVLQSADFEGFGLDAAPVVTPDAKPEEVLRGWWSSNVERTKYNEDDLDIALAALKDVLAGGHFEGVFGFSQGAVMGAMLAGLLERPELHPPFLVDGKPPHPPFKFCISVAGFLPPDERFARFLKPSYSTPTLHVFGLTDPIVSPEQAHTLIAANDLAHARVAPHEGGHFVPSKAAWRNFFRDYIKDPLGEVSAPVPATP
ncbi:hypothetical protein M0805_009096 [Coniferiporia weirii]|nr:hypothetical protein M0805_009096 [Coniferiporia weirii]